MNNPNKPPLDYPVDELQEIESRIKHSNYWLCFIWFAIGFGVSNIIEVLRQ